MAQDGAAEVDEATDAAKTDSVLDSFFEPQCGHGVPSQRLDRTSNSKSFSQSEQFITLRA
jgi:hypothetical protein